ncbi:hypothetical protein JIY74_36150, partial [Vibrio harveyi]|nr:hypothetical protein [Vibrio harveyi]
MDHSEVKFTNKTHDNILKMELYGHRNDLANAFLELQKNEEFIISFSKDTHIEITTKPISKGYTL